MRRTRVLPCIALFALVVTACGSSDDESQSSSSTSTTVAGASDTTVADGSADDSATDTIAPPDSSVTPTPGKPEVAIPGAVPTELKVSELRAGDGEKAVAGDTVVLDYVGVRSADGTEFDNSYDRGAPFTVTLGSGQVIKGWDDGLIGAQTGGQYQLDIPSDLAYGDQGAGDTIKPGDALTFVVDIRVVLHPSTEADQPDIDVPTSSGATEVTTEDLVEGDGSEIVEGENVYLELMAFRGDTGERVDTSWGAGGPWLLQITEGQTLGGLVKGIPGMKVGGRRLITIPADDAFGGSGSDDGKIPANVDLVVVIDAVYAY